MRVMWAHLQDEPGDPCANWDDVRPEFADALRLGLRKDPGERPKTGMDYARALRSGGHPRVATLGYTTSTAARYRPPWNIAFALPAQFDAGPA
jgi:hypothetical protein